MKKLLSREDYERLVKDQPHTTCPFCELEQQIFLGESTHWNWIAALSPYWRYHTLLIPKVHRRAFEELSPDELQDLQSFHARIKKRLLSLNLKHTDGLPADQFIFMIRTRQPDVENVGRYYKSDHLHIHIAPDREGVNRFVLDPSAIEVEIEKLAFSN